MKYLIVLATIFFLAVLPSKASIVRVQETHGQGNTSTATASFGSASTPGSLLIAVVIAVSGTTVTTPTSFSSAVTSTTVGQPAVYFFYEPNAPSTTTITTSLSGSTRWVMFVAEYSGVVASTPLDQTGSANASTGNASTGNVNIGLAGEIIVGVIGTTGQNTYSSPTNGFNLVDQDQSGMLVSAAYLDLITTSLGTYGSTVTNTSGGNGAIASFPANIDNAMWYSMGF
jgi:hypothetical protein